MAKEAEKSLVLALEAESAALAATKHGNKSSAEKILHHAKKQQRVAEVSFSLFFFLILSLSLLFVCVYVLTSNFAPVYVRVLINSSACRIFHCIATHV
jgi:hypothetical protein